jgi:hypothetical protein
VASIDGTRYVVFRRNGVNGIPAKGLRAPGWPWVAARPAREDAVVATHISGLWQFGGATYFLMTSNLRVAGEHLVPKTRCFDDQFLEWPAIVAGVAD